MPQQRESFLTELLRCLALSTMISVSASPKEEGPSDGASPLLPLLPFDRGLPLPDLPLPPAATDSFSSRLIVYSWGVGTDGALLYNDGLSRPMPSNEDGATDDNIDDNNEDSSVMPSPLSIASRPWRRSKKKEMTMAASR